MLKKGVILSAVVCLMYGTAQGASPADKCEAAKNKIAGKYAFCRQKAEARAIRTGAPADYTKCDAIYTDKWMTAETKGGGMCPTNGDESAMQSFITANANTVAAALNGAGVAMCGDNTINVVGEQCDGTELGGESCVTLGFIGGTLGCSSGCALDTSGCMCGGSGGLPETGQTQCDQGAGPLGMCPGSPAGQDGTVLAGATRSFTDNGNGTITDNVTGLMWEKLSRDGSIHERDDVYTWYTAFTSKIATLNSMNFAGHNDWRLPNANELHSLVNYGAVSPAVDVEFNNGCVLGCTVTTCSCTVGGVYWSSTTYQNFQTNAWYVSFSVGFVNASPKTSGVSVRGVRGGS